MNKKVALLMASLAVMAVRADFDDVDLSQTKDFQIKPDQVLQECKALAAQVKKMLTSHKEVVQLQAPVSLPEPVEVSAPVLTEPLALAAVVEAPVQTPVVVTPEVVVSDRALYGLDTMESIIPVLSVAQLEAFVGNHRTELIGVAGIVLAGGSFYVLYRNGAHEALLDFVFDHPKVAATLVVAVTVAVTVGVVAYYKGYTIADLNVSAFKFPATGLTLELPKFRPQSWGRGASAIVCRGPVGS